MCSKVFSVDKLLRISDFWFFRMNCSGAFREKEEEEVVKYLIAVVLRLHLQNGVAD